LRVQRGDRCLQLVGAGPAVAKRSVEQPRSLLDRGRVPACPVLILHQDQIALRRCARIAAGVVQQHERDEPHGLGLVGHQRGHQLGQADRLRAELWAKQLVASGCRVALAEDEVEHGEHDSEPLGQPVVGRDLEGDPGVPDLALGAHQALRHRRLGDQERASDLRRGQPAHRLNPD
jgi:hypothetical protein